MDTNDLQDRASKLLRALEDGDANKARDMLHGEDALELALHVALVLTQAHGYETRTVKATLACVLSILAAERMARETLARAVGNPSGDERVRAAIAHSRAVADLSVHEFAEWMAKENGGAR